MDALLNKFEFNRLFTMSSNLGCHGATFHAPSLPLVTHKFLTVNI